MNGEMNGWMRVCVNDRWRDVKNESSGGRWDGEKEE